MLGILIPISMGFAALAVDAALWHAKRRDVQMAADASAISGAMEMARSGHTTEEIRAAAADDAELNGYVDGADGTTIAVTPDAAARTVAIVVRQQSNSFFARFNFGDSVPISGHATAAVMDALDNACILALDPTAADAVLLDSNSELTANGCGLHVNSDHSSGLRTGANAEVTTDSTCVVGSYQGSGYSPMPEVGCDPIDDPLADLEEPNVGSCDHDDFETDSGTHTLNPGVYCGGLSARSNATLNLEPGMYVIKDGPLHMDSNVVVTGEGVTFFFTGDNAVLDLDSNVALDVSAPTDGEFAGMLMMEDTDNPLLQEHRINSESGLNMEGTVYLPRGRLEVDSNGTVGNDAAYTIIIARRIHLNSNAALQVNSDYESGAPLPSSLEQRVALVQ